MTAQSVLNLALKFCCLASQLLVLICGRARGRFNLDQRNIRTQQSCGALVASVVIVDNIDFLIKSKIEIITRAGDTKFPGVVQTLDPPLDKYLQINLEKNCFQPENKINII